MENVNITAEKQKLEERVKELESEISVLHAHKTEGAVSNNAEATKQIADQAAIIVSNLLHFHPSVNAHGCFRPTYKRSGTS